MIVVNMFGNVVQIEMRDIAPPIRSQTGGCVPMIVQTVYDPSRRHAYEEYEMVCGTLESRMGTGGGNVPIVVETIVFDEGQITCPTNGLNPKWGGCAIPCPGTPEGRL